MLNDHTGDSSSSDDTHASLPLHYASLDALTERKGPYLAAILIPAIATDAR